MHHPLVLIAVAVAFAEPSTDPAIEVQFFRPDYQLKHLLGLFDGSRATDPASALASWKRATKGQRSLGKATEAAIAVLNPGMVAELRTLDRATLILNVEPGEERLRWSFTVPHDDGTFSAFATAIALTDGASEPPLEWDGTPVDRLGPPGSPVMARPGEAVVLGSSRFALTRRLQGFHPRKRQGLPLDQIPESEDRGYTHVALNPAMMARSGSLNERRIGEWLLAHGASPASATAAIDDQGVRLGFSSNWIRPERPGSPPIDPTWYREIPNGASIAFCIAVDPSPKSIDRMFLAADRVEKADPSKAKLAPVRVRLNLLATAARLDPERDLWPHLRGVSGFLLGKATSPTGAGLALHMDDAGSAGRIRERFLPALARALRLPPAVGGAPDVVGTTAIGTLGRRPLLVRNGPSKTVWLVLGNEANAVLETTRNRPELTYASEATIKLDDQPPSRRGWLWPQRLGLATEGSPLDEALAASPCIRWYGGPSDNRETDMIFWNGPRPVLHRFLELIPLEPAPAPGR